MEFRDVIFYVQTMCWDNVYSTFYGKLLFESKNYAEAEAFCLNYKGPEKTIYIQKAFIEARAALEADEGEG